jgi:hypothetical protein
MALVLKINACVKTACTELTITELTGAYSITNTGGYGTPNMEIVPTVKYAVLTITSPSLQVYNIDLFATGYFPNTTPALEYVIPMSQLGNRTFIEDGQWTFLYTVTNGSTEIYTTTRSYIFTCNTECCVAELLSNIEDVDCNCEDTTDQIMNYLKAKAFLDSLKYAAYCGNTSAYTKLKNILDKICAKTSCKTCN